MEGAAEVVGNGAGNLEAPSGPESGALPLPQAPRIWSAKGDDRTLETRMHAGGCRS